MEKAAAPLVTIIFIAFTLALVLFIIAFVFIPRFTMMVQGKCWADAGTTADQIINDLRNAGINSDQKRITLGDCVGGIIIFNRKEVFNDNGDILKTELVTAFSQVIEERCTNPKEQKSFILVIPWKTLADAARLNEGTFSKVFRWVSSPYASGKEFVEWGRQWLEGFKPICKGLDIEVDNTALDYQCIPTAICSNNPADFETLISKVIKQKSISYCYKPVKSAAGYSLQGLTECTK